MKSIIVFDLDGTLYDLNDVLQDNYEIQVDFIASKTHWARERIISYFEEHCVYPIIKENSRSTTELFICEGYAREEWNAFREVRFPVDKIKISKAVTPEIMTKFSNMAECYLLSSNSYITISRILEHIGIAQAFFKDIYCSDRFPFGEKFAKNTAFQKFSKGNINLSIGDRFKSDIEPALAAGWGGIMVKNKDSLSSLHIDLKEGMLGRSANYLYYPSK